MKPLELAIQPQRLAICRFPEDETIPLAAARGAWWSLTRTPEEWSLVVEEDRVPAGCRSERGWRCLRVAGTLDFGLTGVLASIAGPLAEAGISLFAVSTFDTDYVLVHETDLERAADTLRGAGHQVGEAR